MQATRWQDWVSLIFGIWLFFSPWILGYADAANAAWNAYILGVAVVIFSIAALAQGRVWEEWVDLVLGVWLIIAPFVLGFTAEGAAMWNHIVLGILLVIDTVWAMAQGGQQRAA
ncbi:MAG: SPW repeat protein [Gammaproteobacteria bacterium]|nr:SPW repeat protein [Gammaproteobacteria bacterium]